MAEQDDLVLDLPRSSRATRGKRMSKLLDDEVEADDIFWNQEAFQEDALDAEYEADEEVADEFDSDFDEEELESEEEAPEKEERSPRKKKLLPPGKLSVKQKKKALIQKKKELPDIEAATAAAIDLDVLDDLKQKVLDVSPTKDSEVSCYVQDTADLEVERTVRKSTRTAVVVRQAERDALRAALQATNRPVKKKKEGEEKKMTQEEMLLEAAQTEIFNRQNLERMLALEEEVKQKAIAHKTVYSGPQIRFLSRDGRNTLEFIRIKDDPGGVFGCVKSHPKQPICVVTGLPAKYVDPLTGLHYATMEAFKRIREGLKAEELAIKDGRSRLAWKRPRSDEHSLGRSHITRFKEKLSGYLQDNHSWQTTSAYTPENAIISKQASYTNASSEAKIRNNAAYHQLSTFFPATAGPTAEKEVKAAVESTVKSDFVPRKDINGISVVMNQNGANFSHSKNTLSLVTEVANEADFALDVSLPVRLDFNPSSQHGSIKASSEMLPLNAGVQPPVDVLNIEDFSGLDDLL